MKNKKIGLFTGTFDPPTLGHLDIIERASLLFDELYVGVFKNDQKNPLFTTAERQKMLEAISPAGVKIIVHERDLTVNIAKELGVTALVRSVRNAADLVYEENMIYFNREMTGVETILLMAKPELAMISSSRMRELHSFGQEVSQWLPEAVNAALRGK